MTIKKRDKAVFNGLRELGVQHEPVWLEDLCKHLRENGYRTERGGSVVNELSGVVLPWFTTTHPDQGYDGWRIVRVPPDLFRLWRET